MVRMPPTFTRILSRVCLIPLAGAIALTTMAEAAPARPDVTDTAVTENVGRWGHRHVPDLAVSPDAKVGTSSITGVFGRTHYVSLAAPKTRPWNLTYVATLRFWAKADRPNGNILVMLCSNGFQNRRDRVVTVGTEWQLYELALDDKTFAKNVQGKADFTCVRSIVIYNNDATATRVWLDGFELVGEREGRMPVLQLPETSDDRVSVFRLAAVDPFPHLEEAQASRHVAKPRYDLPPVAFNRENAFTDALVDFDQPEGWTARVRDANGYMCLSEDQMLRAVPNLKIELVAVGDAPKVTLIPPKPIRIDRPFDLVECWAYGGKQGGALAFQFRRVDGSLFAAGTDYANTMDDVNPKAIGQFWNLVRIRLPEPIAAGAELLTVELTPKAPKREPDPTCLFHLDQLRVLSFSDVIGKPPPAFNNVGPVVDTFPTHPNGACPQTVGDVRTSVQQDGESYLLAYESDDGQNVTYAYTPTTGTLSDLTVKLPSDATFQPAAASGPVFTFGDRIADTTSDETIAATLRSQALRGDAVHVVWEYTREGHSQTITYQLRLKGKTLQIDASSEQRNLSRWRFGHAQGVRDPKVIEVPFMLYCPNVLLTHGLFVTYYSDWYVSNVSMLPYGGDAIIEDDAVWYNWRRDQSFAYHPRTDGQRHPFRERFYITASNTIDDVMLSVRNPPSPVKNTLKTRLYRMILASAPGIFRKTRALVDQYNTYGMTDAYVLFHAPLWFRRQAGSEAFCGGMNVSMLHEPEGGDRGLIDLFAHMKAMGIAPGYYDGYPARDYTDPEFRYDWCAYTPEGDWKRMWRCAGLKPWAFPELAATLYKKRA
ncbi:MAG: hypothetical protein HON70_11310, partial [Lentisphaerae bacterium]|nr:hypothetical protein [Lentisphaerota bacterium]